MNRIKLNKIMLKKDKKYTKPIQFDKQIYTKFV